MVMSGFYWGSIRLIERCIRLILGLSWGYIGIMENKMETTI